MRRSSTLTVLFSLIVVLFFVAPWSAARAAEKLTIMHLNDFHGRVFSYTDKAVSTKKPVGGAAYLAALIEGERTRNPKGTVLLSAGDMFQGTPDSNLFQGRPVLDFMNAIRFEAMTLGNHEFDWGRDVLNGIIGDAQFPVLSANITKKDGSRMAGTSPYALLKRRGIKIAVIGLTTPEIAHMVNAKSMGDLAIKEPEEILPSLIDEVKAKGARLVVLLTHLGFDVDKRLASAVNGIDIIVGGHSHTAVTQPVKVGKTIVVQAGYNGTYLGVLDLSFDRKTGRVTTAVERRELRTVFAGPGDRFDAPIARIADSYRGKIKDKFMEIVGETAVDLKRRSDGESNMGDLITDAMRQAGDAEIAMCNSGGIRADIPSGKITMEQIYTVLPFDNVLVAMDLKGEEILSLLEGSANMGKGMLQISGLRVTYDLTRSAGSQVVEASVNGALIDRARNYRVVTNDFLSAGGDRFIAFQKGTNVVNGNSMRDVVTEHIRKASPLNVATDGRIRFTQ